MPLPIALWLCQLLYYSANCFTALLFVLLLLHCTTALAIALWLYNRATALPFTLPITPLLCHLLYGSAICPTALLFALLLLQCLALPFYRPTYLFFSLPNCFTCW